MTVTLLKVLLFWGAGFWVHGYRHFEGNGVFIFKDKIVMVVVVVVVVVVVAVVGLWTAWPVKMKALLLFIRCVSEKFYGKSTEKVVE
jgi:uncharacterized membrane protein